MMADDVLTIETLRKALSTLERPPEPMFYPLSSYMYDNFKEYMGVTDEVMRNNYRFIRSVYLPIT